MMLELVGLVLAGYLLIGLVVTVPMIVTVYHSETDGEALPFVVVIGLWPLFGYAILKAQVGS